MALIALMISVMGGYAVRPLVRRFMMSTFFHPQLETSTVVYDNYGRAKVVPIEMNEVPKGGTALGTYAGPRF
eukprot:1086269-Prorocentrum_minimum.AAC.2